MYATARLFWRDLLLVLLRLTATQRVASGIRIIDAAGKPGEHERGGVVEAALRIIERFDRTRLLRVRRDLKNIIVVEREGGSLSYGPYSGSLDLEQLRDQPPATLAATIIELGTRAKLLRRFPEHHRFSQKTRNRIYRLSIREQIAFVHQLPREEFTGIDDMLAFLSRAREKYSSHARPPNVSLQPTCGEPYVRVAAGSGHRRMRLNSGVRRSSLVPGSLSPSSGPSAIIFALLPTSIIFEVFAAAASNRQPEFTMISVKEEVATLLESLPDDCSVEDIQYHLYVLEKVRRGLERADTEGSISQEDAEARLSKWLVE